MSESPTLSWIIAHLRGNPELQLWVKASMQEYMALDEQVEVPLEGASKGGAGKGATTKGVDGKGAAPKGASKGDDAKGADVASPRTPPPPRPAAHAPPVDEWDWGGPPLKEMPVHPIEEAAARRFAEAASLPHAPGRRPDPWDQWNTGTFINRKDE